PGRFWLCQGSGQALNENITGDKWPAKEIRNARLKESVEMIRELWKGDYVTHHGIVNVENAKLFTPPETTPTICGAAITEKTAKWLGSWADGMITISKPIDELKKMTAAFKEEGGEGKKLALKVQVSYAANEDKALEGAWEQWKNNIFPSKLISEINTADQFDALGDSVRKEDIREPVIVGSQSSIYIEKIELYLEL